MSSKFNVGDLVFVYGYDSSGAMNDKATHRVEAVDGEFLDVRWIPVARMSSPRVRVHVRQCRRIKPRKLKVGDRVSVSVEHFKWVVEQMEELFCIGGTGGAYDGKYDTELLCTLMAVRDPVNSAIAGTLIEAAGDDDCFKVEMTSKWGTFTDWIGTEHLARIAK